MRLFIAFNLPAELRARITTEVIAPLRERLPGVRWVREEMLHLTLLFLGERSEEEARKAGAVVRQLAATQSPFQGSIRGLGVFPGLARPRVVWLGLADPAPVQEMYGALKYQHARLGMPVETRAFHPHFTLGRVSPSVSRDICDTLTLALKTVQFEAPVMFRSLDLMRSELTPKGPRYTELVAAPLTHQ